jgi:hypothetical protein
MRKFVVTLSYELGGETPPEAHKLLRAELCGRRWRDRCKDRPMPRGTLWMERTVDDDATTSTVHDVCASDLRTSAAAVARAGLPLRVVRAWLHVSGGGTYGLAGEDALVVPSE